jgi:hypothetical protein
MLRAGRWWVVPCLLWSAGCDGCRPAPPPGVAGPLAGTEVVGVSRGLFLPSINRHRVDGDEWVTESSIAACGTVEGAIVFVIWAAGPPGESWGGASAGDDRGWHGEFIRPAGEPVQFRVESADGRAGSATIGGRRFDLAGGRLFLVAARGAGIEVRQLDRPLPDRGGSATFLDPLRGDAEVKEFFAGTAFLHRQKAGKP